MRFSRRIFILLLLVCWPVQAQDSDFPTLDALAELDIPAYDYYDVASRLSWVDRHYSPLDQSTGLPNRRANIANATDQR